MRIETALAKRDAAVRSFRDLYSMAYHAGMTQKEMGSYKARILEGLAKCPEWVRAYVRGYETALFDRLFAASPMGKPALVFGGIVNGRFYSVHRDRPDYYEKHGLSPADFSDDGRVSDRSHYWGHFDPPRTF